MANILSRLLTKGNGADKPATEPRPDPRPEPAFAVEPPRRPDPETVRAKRDAVAILASIHLLADTAEDRIDDIE